MTREEALKDITNWGYLSEYSRLIINKIYDAHEAELKAKDKEILALVNRVADITKENVEANNRIAELESKNSKLEKQYAHLQKMLDITLDMLEYFRQQYAHLQKMLDITLDMLEYFRQQLNIRYFIKLKD